MAGIQLVTSIPPMMSRIDALGRDVGKSYQEDCISSWIDAGFEPISVNSTNEVVKPAVRMTPVSRDASEVTGRPHVYFGDLLTTAVMEAPDGPIAIVNADILFPPHADLSDRVRGVRPGQVIFSRRLDTDVCDRTTGTPYWSGFDFFAVHTSDLTDFRDTSLVFGAPWWDHLFPLAMHMRGCHLMQIEPSVIHLKHAERWSPSVWEVLGWRFLSEIQAASTDENYRLQLTRAQGDSSAGRRSRLKVKLATALHVHRTESDLRMLHRVSELNIAFLDRMSLPDY
jgi:hypothetical protein